MNDGFITFVNLNMEARAYEQRERPLEPGRDANAAPRVHVGVSLALAVPSHR